MRYIIFIGILLLFSCKDKRKDLIASCECSIDETHLQSIKVEQSKNQSPHISIGGEIMIEIGILFKKLISGGPKVDIGTRNKLEESYQVMINECPESLQKKVILIRALGNTYCATDKRLCQRNDLTEEKKYQKQQDNIKEFEKRIIEIFLDKEIAFNENMIQKVTKEIIDSSRTRIIQEITKEVIDSSKTHIIQEFIKEVSDSSKREGVNDKTDSPQKKNIKSILKKSHTFQFHQKELQLNLKKLKEELRQKMSWDYSLVAPIYKIALTYSGNLQHIENNFYRYKGGFLEIQINETICCCHQDPDFKIEPTDGIGNDQQIVLEDIKKSINKIINTPSFIDKIQKSIKSCVY